MSQGKSFISALTVTLMIILPLHVDMAHGADGVSYEALSKVANDVNKTLRGCLTAIPSLQPLHRQKTC